MYSRGIFPLLLLLVSLASCGNESRSDGSGNVSVSDPCATLGGDEDGDQVCNALDNCETVANSGQRDSDGDGIGDACDPETTACARQGDIDSDGICNDIDNCITVANGDQQDSDGDGVGDACDPRPDSEPCSQLGGDADSDQVCQAFDNCPDNPNPNQRDADADGLGDPCDATPAMCDDWGGDADGDGVCDDFDNCTGTHNPLQYDKDGDGTGDACDPDYQSNTAAPPCSGLGGDMDGDDWCSIYDNCPGVANPDQSDLDGDGIGDACDAEECDGRDNNGDGNIDEGMPDADGDTVPDCTDICPGADDKLDADKDGIPDCKDKCPDDSINDPDFDNVCGLSDNCPTTANYNQGDRDGDGIGDACDVETCDGISNDLDTFVDEGMPDADGDGLCDEIDPCVDDASNDLDADGVCGNTDNCPHVPNPLQEDVDQDGWGDACELYATDCSAAAELQIPGVVQMPATWTLSAMAADPTREVIYLALPSSSAAYPNSVVAVDAPTASVLWSLPVGSEPNTLAVAHDGSILYVGLDGAARVRAVNLATRQACASFSLGYATYYGPLFAGDMDVVPGSPQVLVVSMRRKGVSPDFGGVAVFDHGWRRPQMTPDHTGARVITIASADTVYGYNNSSTEYGLRRLTISEDGIEEVLNQRDLISGFSLDILYAGGSIFATNGRIVDAATMTLLGTTAGNGPVAARPTLDEVYYATSDKVVVYDTTTFLWSRDVSVVGLSSPKWIATWGDTGIAVGTTAKLYLVADTP